MASPHVDATCGSSYCFLETGTREGLQEQGSLHVDFSYQYIDQSRKLEGSHRVNEVLAPKISFEEMAIEPDHHREISTRNTLIDLNFVYGVTSRIAVYTYLPLYNNRDHEHTGPSPSESARRLSVVPATATHWKIVTRLGGVGT